MIQIRGGTMRFGGRVLFEGLDWLIGAQDRVGVVGANGSGKTTLLKILAGLEQLDRGQVRRPKGVRIGYLPQDGLSLSGRTVFDECLSVFDEAMALEREQEQLGETMSAVDPQSPEYEQAAGRFEWILDRLHSLDAYTKEAQAGMVLSGLAFPKDDWNRRTEEFSGGWQMRIALAKLLLEKPNLLLLDEPTNHLDLEARNWLEDYLGNYPYAFLLISHDRYFLDMTVRKIVEIWNKGVHFYTGNYSKFEQQKAMRLEQLRAAHNNQQQHIRRLEVFINRFRYKASKAKQVQSRIKELEKIDRIEIPEEEETIHFRFPQPPASGRVVMACEGVAKRYGEHEVFRGVTFNIERGDRIALVGANGAGKSTLIRILAGTEPLTSGERRPGHNVEVDYFAQDQYKTLNPELRLIDDLTALVPGFSDSELRGLLGCFLFSGDDVFKPIGVLSGGERNRYALARMLVRPSNFLLLDEPTNHLDLRAKDVLLEALLAFTGTLVFVSHDRYFIDRLANKVFAVGGGEVRVYPGNYEDYRWQVQAREGAPGAGEQEDKGVASVEAAIAMAKQEQEKAANGSNGGRRSKRMNPQRAEMVRRRVHELEEEIGRLEEEMARLEPRLTEAFKSQEPEKILAKMQERKQKIEACEREWEELSEKLEEGE